MSNELPNEAPPTMAQIAKLAGVSVPTVSKVVNGRHDVAEHTRHRVERMLSKHGYVSNAAARALRAARTGLVDLVVEDLESPYHLEIIRGVEEGLAVAGVGTVVTAMQRRGHPTRDWLGAIRSRRTDGVVLVLHNGNPKQVAELRQLAAPFVLVDHWSEPEPSIPSVGATNWAGAFAATRHLIDLGHVRIAMIGGPDDLSCSRARRAGYRAALEEAGIEYDHSLYRVGDFLPGGGRKHAADLMALTEPPTAIFAGSDLQAFGVLDGMRRLQLMAPDDVSVVGFDDISLAQFASPPLTTVRQPLFEMGRSAASMLLRLIDRQPLDAGRIELATTLVIRESTSARLERGA